MPTLHLGFLASHGGSNMQAIINACKHGRLDAIPCAAISNNRDSFALERARDERIPSYHLSSRTHPEPEKLDEEILSVLRKHGVDTVILAGYMKRLGPRTLGAYQGRVLNIHPALLPKYGGKGMYGRFVHEAVLAAGERESGATVHIVTAEYDQGPIVNQCRVPVYPDDTVETLSARVLGEEHKLYVETLQKIANGEIKLEGT
ncbi:MAG: phosphoribosylglycinamide formyltransferase [Bacillota bacterium]